MVFFDEVVDETLAHSFFNVQSAMQETYSVGINTFGKLQHVMSRKVGVYAYVMLFCQLNTEIDEIWFAKRFAATYVQ
jgi:hypothetical protein